MNKTNEKTANPSADTELEKNTGVHSLPRTSGKSNKQKLQNTPASSNSNERRHPKPETKASLIVKKLHSTRGVTIEALVQLTGWQAHSVRGFLSRTVRKRLSLNLTGQTGKDGNRRYRIEERTGK